MKNKANIHTKVILIVTIGSIGLVIESITQGWEFWVPPLIVLGHAILWAMHLTQYGDEKLRENALLIVSFSACIFHGVHSSSFFDIAIVNVLLTVTLSMLGNLRVMNLTLIEYFLMLAIQLIMALRFETIEFDFLTISRIVLHSVVALSVYFNCRWIIKDRKKLEESIDQIELSQQESLDNMEDFLVNISHELRTPVNVINGITSLILKNEKTEDLISIREAGLRLSRQIEDIQDYTEIKHKSVVTESENYMITSLVNDVLSNFRFQDNCSDLDLIIDLDPTVPYEMKGDIRKLHKILRHLIDNAVKFTKNGGVYIRITVNERDYGVNLIVEVTDTGIGMSRKVISNLSHGLYQANKKRTRSSGGIGLGLYISYGLVHAMNGFITISSKKGVGTTVRVSIPQEVEDKRNCLVCDKDKVKNVIFHDMPEKHKSSAVREFYKRMAVNVAAGMKINLYSAATIKDIRNLMDRFEVSHIFMGVEEYEKNSSAFDELALSGTVVAVSAPPCFTANPGSRVVVMPKPLYGYPVTKVLNCAFDEDDPIQNEKGHRPMFNDIRVLIVDDEPMNLVVATGMFRDYGMITDTADSGKEALDKFQYNDYDVIFMDHMMPEMDGVEAMKRLRQMAREKNTGITIVALTANALSGAREMFLREGFDGFIAKPIDIMDFERVMKRLIPSGRITYAERSGS